MALACRCKRPSVSIDFAVGVDGALLWMPSINTIYIATHNSHGRSAPTKERKLWEDTRQSLIVAAQAPHMHRDTQLADGTAARTSCGFGPTEGTVSLQKMAQAPFLGHQLAFTALMSLTRFWARQIPKI